MKILILEDNTTDADLCKRAIANTIDHCTIDLAQTIAEAKKLIRTDTCYDVALLDINLPDGNGLELLSEIREKELDTAVVIFTDQGNEELAVSALKAGADDYIPKKQGFIAELPRVINLAISNFRQNQKHQTEIIKVIYIEHNPVDVDLTLRHLKKYAPNVSVEIISTAEDALKILPVAASEKYNGHYHLMMLDYRLPGMSAFDFIKIIRQERMIEIPIIIISGQGDEEIAVQAMKLGANNYITKNENYLFKLPLLINNAYKQCELIRKQTELTTSELKYRLLAENSRDVIFTLNKELKFTYSSPAVKQLSGYDPEEIISQQISEVMTPESFEMAAEMIDEYLTYYSEKLNELLPERTIELELTRKDGSTVWTEVKVSMMKDDKGEISGIVGVSRDISKRRAATEELRKLSRAVEQSPESIFITNTLGDIEFCNPAVSVVTGYSKEEVIGNNPRIFGSGTTVKEVYKAIWETIASGKIWEGEFQNKKKNGDLYWEAASISPVVDHSGKITHYLAIKKDITEQKKMTVELIKAKEKAQESDRLKSAFLANMSHEIRTPMNGILGFATLLKEPGLSGQKQQVYIRVIEKSGARMLNIINDIVDISKIEAGLMKVYWQETNINEQIEFVYAFFNPEVEAKGMKLSFSNSLPNEKAVIYSDPEKLYSILSNLIKNAVKFTHTGTIEFGYVIKEGFLEFFVKDSGVGIPKDRQKAIFERFIQADIEDKNAYQGAGLGLSISKAFIEMLGGKIWVESIEGQGSSFYFTLPYHTEIYPENNFRNESSSPIEIEPKTHLKILIAEDDEASETLISLAVYKFAKKIIHARTGLEAVEACQNHQDIDLVLMDIMLPEMDGYEATRQIRKFNSQVVIIAQTAYALEGDKEKALAAGCTDYITKPTKTVELQQMIVKYFK
jgi:PAS domain S-box-containing protein